MTRVMLETRDLSVRFGGITAVHRVSLTCTPGQITGLIGPNGAGKTTFVDAVTGFLPRNSDGEILLDGEPILGLPPHRLVRKGLSRTWQGADLFGDLDVRGNLEVAAGDLTFGGAIKELLTRRRAIPRVEALISEFELDDLADRTPASLPSGEQRWIGIARALASEPKLLLLDEPAAGLDRQETRELADKLRTLRDRGHSILLIDHDMGLVLGVCDMIHVLDFGELIASGPPERIRFDAAVVRAYLGDTSEASNG